MPNPSSFTMANALAGCGLVDFSGVRPISGAFARGLRFIGPTFAALSLSLAAGLANRTVFALQSEKVQAAGPGISIPGLVDWVAGNYVIRLNVTTANFNVDWVETRMFAVSDACGNLGQIGIDTTVQSMGTTGVKTVTIAGSAISPGDLATLYVAFVFTNNNAFMLQVWQVTGDQLIDTPFVMANKKPSMGVMH